MCVCVFVYIKQVKQESRLTPSKLQVQIYKYKK